MKIAIPSSDQISVFPHFGKTDGFLIFTIEDRKITDKHYVINSFTGHAQGQHNHHDHGNQEHVQHSHSGILQALYDCDVVIAGGMGRRLYNDLENAKKQIFVTKENIAETAVEKYLSESLDNNVDSCCNH